jgi:uncharacterized protein
LIFIDILHTFYSLLLQVAPWLGISLVLAALSTELLPANTLDRLFKKSKGSQIPVAVFYSAILPATAAYKVIIAAFTRRTGSNWVPTLSFVGAGASVGIASLVVTAMISWQLAALRLVLALVFGFIMSLIIAKYFEPKLTATAMDFEVESLLSRDFVEVKEENLNRENKPSILDLWDGLVRIARITIPWFFLSLFLATLIKTIVPGSVTDSLFGGSFSLVWIALLGIPFYFIGGAEIPLIYVLMQGSMKMGGASVLMLAAPLINVPVFITMSRWLGYRVSAIYMAISWLLIVIIGFAIGLGLQ